MLQPRYLSPDTATAALRRLKPTPDELATFRGHLAEMLKHLDPHKIERHGETHILDFLRSVSKPAEGGARYGNVKDKRDLVLHLGDTADSPVGVVLEVKGPKNPKEMLAPDDLNRKALHQLLLYYLEDRTDDKADDFRRLIVTTGYEWYLFDALDFNRLFWKDKGFVKDFLTWKAGAKATCYFALHMATRRLITNFESTAKMDIGPLAQNCLTNLAGNARYPDAKNQITALQDALTPYQTAASVLHPTPTQTAELAQLRTTLNQSLSAMAQMANALYPQDEAALLSTGLPLSKERERHTVLEVPGKFQLVDGPQPGTLCAKAKRPPHAVALKYVYTLDATKPDNQWLTVVVRDGDALLTACKTADRVYCKVAAVGGDTDQQPYSAVPTRLVQ